MFVKATVFVVCAISAHTPLRHVLEKIESGNSFQGVLSLSLVLYGIFFLQDRFFMQSSHPCVPCGNSCTYRCFVRRRFLCNRLIPVFIVASHARIVLLGSVLYESVRSLCSLWQFMHVSDKSDWSRFMAQ